MRVPGSERARGDRGFTLIELLVVIIIIAALASIAIPTFLGQRQKAQDSAAFTLLRNGLTAMQAAFVDTGDYTQVTVAMLTEIEPSVSWSQGAQNLVETAPPSIAAAAVVGAGAIDNEIAFYPQSAVTVDLAVISKSGNSFGIQIDTVSLSETGYVKVKVVDGSAELGW